MKRIKVFKCGLGSDLEHEVNLWIRQSVNCKILDIFPLEQSVIIYYEVKELKTKGASKKR